MENDRMSNEEFKRLYLNNWDQPTREDILKRLLERAGDQLAKKYNHSPLFHQCIDSVLHNDDVMYVIKQLVGIIEGQQKTIIELTQNRRPKYFIKDI
jgi:hypothetical protein